MCDGRLSAHVKINGHRPRITVIWQLMPLPGNPCEYPHIPYFLEIVIISCFWHICSLMLTASGLYSVGGWLS